MSNEYIVEELCKEAAYHANAYQEKIATLNKVAADLGEFASWDDYWAGKKGLSTTGGYMRYNPVTGGEDRIGALGDLAGISRAEKMNQRSATNAINNIVGANDAASRQIAAKRLAGSPAYANVEPGMLTRAQQSIKDFGINHPYLKNTLLGLGGAAALGGLGYGAYKMMQPSNEDELAKTGSYNPYTQMKIAAYRQALLDM